MILKSIYKKLPNSLKSKIRIVYNFYINVRTLRRLKKQDAIENILQGVKLSKPKIINMKAIDSCNSHCLMCNIWKNKKQDDLTPEQFKKILSNSLFSEIQYVGITGGEPTLREDLIDIYKVVISEIPTLRGLSIITNGIKWENIYSKIIEINKLCKKSNISFSVMISLDGISKIHDKIRGTKGNFESSIKLINKLKSTTNIPISLGCTISKDNVWYVDDLLSFVKKINVYTRFRVAEYINVLYNDQNNVIRNFNDDEKYHLQLFFKKLQLTYEKDETIKRTYDSIIEMLGGRHRQIGCPYHKDGVVLGSEGEILYCAPKSKELGNALEKSAIEIYNTNITEKQRIVKEDCKNCIHDYHATVTYKEYKKELILNYSKKIIYKHQTFLKFSFFIKPFIKQKKNLIFIIGWYGTETVGDKAILGGIVDFYNKKYNNCSFVIGSLYPFITKRTISELNIKAKIVDSNKFDLIKYSAKAKEVVMGGGPLMDLDELRIPLIAFRTANKFKRHTVVFGSGIGPLTNNKHIASVKEILKRSSEIKVRDSISQNIAKEWTKRNDIQMTGDPAAHFINKIKVDLKLDKKNELACFLREWSPKYAGGYASSDFIKNKINFEQGIANKIKQLLKENNIEKVKLYSMHNFVVGNDDRDFARYFIDTYFPDSDFISYEKGLSTVNSISTAMKSSKLNLCMRFHSVLFAKVLNTEFYAIDYTLGGKIYKFLQDNNEIGRIITFKQLTGNEPIANKYIR